MGLNIANQKNLPIGVDLGTAAVKVAQLRTLDGSLELCAAGSVEVPPERRDRLSSRLDFQADQIRRVLRNGGFKGRQAAVSLPAVSTFVQPVKVPSLEAKELDRAVRKELQGKLPYPVEEAVIRHMLAATVYNDGEDMEERIVVAVPRLDLETYLDVARHAGLEVVSVNIESCAVVQCFARLFRRDSDQTRVTLFVDLGSSSTQVILAHGRQMVFARNLAAGGQTLDKAVSDALKVPQPAAQAIRRKIQQTASGTPAEDDLFRLLDGAIGNLAGQITQCLRYYESVFRNHAIERAIFVGGQAHNRRLCQAIAERLNLPAQVGDPMVGVRRSEEATRGADMDFRQPQPAWAVAVGLSLGSDQAA